jgi:hypothetical protein
MIHSAGDSQKMFRRVEYKGRLDLEGRQDAVRRRDLRRLNGALA